MTATLGSNRRDRDVTSILDFGVIKRRVAEIKGIDKTDVTDLVMGEFFGHARETMTRFRSGALKPKLQTALDMADKLGLTVEQIRARP